ncbi:MAG: hypothetical protein NTZ17_18465 [Phycisphaerae bacterium]|nr:hypothetical protein [Phycisphaerae bacterium]
MAEFVAEREIESSRQIGGRHNALGIMSTCIKAIVVLFPLPTAFLPHTPIEMKLAGVYATLVTLGLFLALAEIASGIRRLAEAADRQRRPL